MSAAGAYTVRYGGETSSIEVRADDGSLLVLDAGSGIRRLGDQARALRRVDILLTHLHMDHIQGLGFFAPLYSDEIEVHIWGPASSEAGLFGELTRYLSPPLFPARLRDQPLVEVHEISRSRFTVGPFTISSDYVIHPGRTLGYRVQADGATLAYLSDHEPMLGWDGFPSPEWLSGFDLARDVDLLIHDAQYTADEYPSHVGWGHSTLEHALAFAGTVGARHLCTFHHDPSHHDDMLHEQEERARRDNHLGFQMTSGIEGATFILRG